MIYPQISQITQIFLFHSAESVQSADFYEDGFDFC